jgi:basic amino acid/polyamine antiporter, APA family
VAKSDAEMRKVLDAKSLVLLGIGGIIGAGVFVLTGVGAKVAAGPSIILSYLISAAAAFLAALCYTEFAVDLPVAGGAFAFIFFPLPLSLRLLYTHYTPIIIGWP